MERYDLAECDKPTNSVFTAIVLANLVAIIGFVLLIVL